MPGIKHPNIVSVRSSLERGRDCLLKRMNAHVNAAELFCEQNLPFLVELTEDQLAACNVAFDHIKKALDVLDQC